MPVTVVVGAWTLLALIAAGNVYIRGVASGVPDLQFFPIAREQVLDHWIWAALTPLLFWLARALPFTKRTAIRSGLLHFAACIACSFLHVTVAEVIHLAAVVPRGYHGPELLGRFLINFYADVWMYWPVIALWNLLEYQKKYRERELRTAHLQAQLATAQVEALRNQLHPHFLFNTLNSISALIQEDSEAAEDMLADLSYMLRGALAGPRVQEITLAHELDLLTAYFRIQARRFADRLNVRLDIPPGIMNALVPSLILQPLAENAVQHGIAPLSRAGTVRIRASRCEGTLGIEVADDGRGLPAQYREGIGLSNTRARLRQLYGDGQRLSICGGEPAGVVVKVELPYREISEEGEEDGDSYDDRRRRAAGAPPASLAAHD